MLCRCVRSPIFEHCRVGIQSYSRGTVIGPFCDCARGTQGYGRGGDAVLANLTNNGMYFIGPFEE